jgi:phospholipid/cholesterol/gamma-HCH transport system substrate-binding protein
MAKKRSIFPTEVVVGVFVIVGLVLTAAAILTLGNSDNIFTRNNRYVSHFDTVDGLIPGAKVAIGGFQVGTVTAVEFDNQTRNLKVTYKVARKYGEWIRTDSIAEIQTQGMLGDKFVNVTAGTPENPIVQDGGELPAQVSKGLAQVLSESDKLMSRLTSIATSLDQVLKEFQANKRSETLFQGLSVTAKNLSSLSAQLESAKLGETAKQLNAIIAKVNAGTGTLGALINDPGLYYDVRAMMGGANRNKVIRNLVRQTVKDGEKRVMQDPDSEQKTKSAP